MGLTNRLSRLEKRMPAANPEAEHKQAMGRALSAVSDSDLLLLERIAERGGLAETEEELAASSRFIALYDRELSQHDAAVGQRGQ